MPKRQKLSLDQMPAPDKILESLPIDEICPWALQPRNWFDGEELHKLAQSLVVNQQIAPIIVRPRNLDKYKYEVIVGERRLRASRLAGLTYIEAEIRELDDRAALILAMEENNIRQELNPIEDTISTLNLIAIDTGLSHEEIKSLLYQLQKGRNVPTDFAEAIEKVFEDLNTVSLSTFIKDRLRLLNLPKQIYQALAEGKIEHTKAIIIARVKEEEQMQELLEEAIANNLTISELKARIKQLKGEIHTDYSQLSESELKQRVKNAYGKVSRNSKIWSDANKRKKLESLLKNLDSLIES